MNYLKRLKNYLTEASYRVGFIKEEFLDLPVKERYSHICWIELKDYNSGWFADPFFLSVTDNHIQLLVEEFVYSQNKGIISLLEIRVIDGKYELEKRLPILDLPTHLSFPNIWRENGKIYVYPENWHSGGLNLYELDIENARLVNPVKIVDVPLVDSSIFKYDGKYYVIGTRRQSTPFEDMKSADIYVADSLQGPYVHFQSIQNSRRIERGAGEIYNEKEGLVRPVQKCDRDYGEAVFLNKLYYKDGSFEESFIKSIEPDKKHPFGQCLHTFNKMNGICVIDGKLYKRPVAARIVKAILRVL